MTSTYRCPKCKSLTVAWNAMPYVFLCHLHSCYWSSPSPPKEVVAWERSGLAEEVQSWLDGEASRLYRVVRRACEVMGWDYQEGAVTDCLRGIDKGVVAVISLDKLTQMLDRIDRMENQRCPKS